MLEKRLFYIVLQKFVTIKKYKWYRIDLQTMLLNETLKTNLKQDYQNWKWQIGNSVKLNYNHKPRL